MAAGRRCRRRCRSRCRRCSSARLCRAISRLSSTSTASRCRARRAGRQTSMANPYRPAHLRAHRRHKWRPLWRPYRVRCRRRLRTCSRPSPTALSTTPRAPACRRSLPQSPALLRCPPFQGHPCISKCRPPLAHTLHPPTAFARREQVTDDETGSALGGGHGARSAQHILHERREAQFTRLRGVDGAGDENDGGGGSEGGESEGSREGTACYPPEWHQPQFDTLKLVRPPLPALSTVVLSPFPRPKLTPNQRRASAGLTCRRGLRVDRMGRRLGRRARRCQGAQANGDHRLDQDAGGYDIVRSGGEDCAIHITSAPHAPLRRPFGAPSAPRRASVRPP